MSNERASLDKLLSEERQRRRKLDGEVDRLESDLRKERRQRFFPTNQRDFLFCLSLTLHLGSSFPFVLDRIALEEEVANVQAMLNRMRNRSAMHSSSENPSYDQFYRLRGEQGMDRREELYSEDHLQQQHQLKQLQEQQRLQQQTLYQQSSQPSASPWGTATLPAPTAAPLWDASSSASLTAQDNVNANLDTLSTFLSRLSSLDSGETNYNQGWKLNVVSAPSSSSEMGGAVGNNSGIAHRQAATAPLYPASAQRPPPPLDLLHLRVTHEVLWCSRRHHSLEAFWVVLLHLFHRSSNRKTEGKMEEHHQTPMELPQVLVLQNKCWKLPLFLWLLC